MPRRTDSKAAKKPSASHEEVCRSLESEKGSDEPSESVTLGVGSRGGFVEEGHEPAKARQLRGLLPVPPEVEAEVRSQEARHPMTPEFRKALRDRLTLGHHFADVEVAFRRMPEGIEVVAVGYDEIAAFRRTSRPEERQGVVYGVG
jgi:hypothetical protein